MSTFYLVSASADYYPQVAPNDWVSVHLDEAEARTVFEAEVRSRGGMFVTLIRVTPPTWRVLAEMGRG